MTEFIGNRKLVTELHSKAKAVSSGKPLDEAGIDLEWARAYSIIARRCKVDKDFGITPCPYEQGPRFGAFAGGLFQQRKWPIRKALEKHSSLRPVYEYEANYINSAGYWMAFHESAMDLRDEALEEKTFDEVKRYDVWASLAVRYGLRVLGLRVEFYRMVGRDPVYAKMIMPTLEQRNEVAAADDLIEAKEKLGTHLTTQLMKAVANLSASNSTKRSGKGGDAGGKAIQFGIFDAPHHPFVPREGEEIGDIPQTEEDREFARKDLEEGCRSGIYQEVSREYAMRAKQSGAIISSAFVVRQDSEEGKKGRFVINLSKPSKHWKNRYDRMESLSEFAMSIQRNDHFLSMDIVKGYRAFRLAPSMRDLFIFRWEGRFYQCVGLPFGWGRAPLWFTQLMVPFVKALRQLGYRVLAYLDDFLIAPSPIGEVASLNHCIEARKEIEKLLKILGLRKHPTKRELVGSTSIEHLGVHINSST